MANSNELLSDDEILQILQNFGEPKAISDIEWELLEIGGELLGFLGKHLRLTIRDKIDGDTIVTLFVKSLPNIPQQSELLREFFKKETKIYSHILSQMPDQTTIKWTPKSYYSRDDILVLEDLSLENYQLMPNRHTFSKVHVQLVLKSLANLHANSLYLEKKILKKSIDELYDETLFESSVVESNIWFNTGLQAIKAIALKRTRFSSDTKMHQKIHEHFDTAIKKVFEICNSFPQEFIKVFCHRDIWRNNLMYKFEDGNSSKPLQCALIDYQIARYMPPAADVMMTLYMLQRVNERESDFQENIKYYYDQLGQSLRLLEIDEVLSYSEFIKTCDYFKLLGVVLKCIFLQMTHLPDGVIDKIHSNEDDYTQFIMVDRSEILLKYIDSDEHFRTWMIESVEELIEMIFV